MYHFKSYPFWDLIAEESYLYKNPVLRKGTRKNFFNEEAGKNVYLFGCNDACRLFIEENGRKLNIKGILDNSAAKSGSVVSGKTIFLPGDIIPQLDPDKDVIIISMRFSSDAIASQIDSYGFHNYYGLALLIAGAEPYSSLIKLSEDAKRRPLENIILFESTDDFDGNSGALYKYLIRSNYHYKYIWIVKNSENRRISFHKDTVTVCPGYSEEEMKKYILYRAIAKWQFWDNMPIKKVRREQINVFLQHFGMGYKQVRNIYNSPDYVDYVLIPTPAVYQYVSRALCYGNNTRIIYGELPRNDVLFSSGWNELQKLSKHTFSKIIMWAPTLRESNTFNRLDSDKKYPFGIPLIYDEMEMDKLNRFLNKYNILLIIKIHPRQKHNYEEKNLKNIVYINEKNYKTIDTYKLMTQVDAMISDYSSIVFDYMILNRPIAWVLEDLKNYQIPLLVTDLEKFMPGYKIYSIEQLYGFIRDIQEGVDLYSDQRSQLSGEYNAPLKGKGCEHLVQYLGV